MNCRMDKINAEISKALSEIFTYEIQNPKITGIITVTNVDTTSDLDYCTIKLSIFTPDDKEEVFNQIKHSAGFIRKQLCGKVLIRKMPFLTFELDEGLEYSNQINNVIAKIEKEREELENNNKNE